MRLHSQPLQEGETVVRQGEPGHSMYFIARGVMRSSKDGQGSSDEVATFIAGDFFGDDAVLSGGPYLSTATAMTSCSLYRLERADLEVAMANSPVIRDALERSGKGHPTPTDIARS